MQLVVEGTGQFRRIISVSVDGHVYTLGPDQAIRLVADWGARRRPECCWDEVEQVIVDSPYPLSPAEQAAASAVLAAEQFKEKIPSIVKDLAIRVAILEKGVNSGYNN